MSSLLIIKLFWGNQQKSSEIGCKTSRKCSYSWHIDPILQCFIPRAYSQTVTSSQPYQLAVG